MPFVSDIAVFVLKRDVTLQPTNRLKMPQLIFNQSHSVLQCFDTVGLAAGRTSCL